MKKRTVFLTMLLLCLLLGGCCSHQWLRANCTEPERCIHCEKIQGQALGHDMLEPSCTQASLCSRCGYQEGEPAGHKWEWEDCSSSGICSVCGEENPVQGHSWERGLNSDREPCLYCGETCCPHQLAEGSCIEGGTCFLCGEWVVYDQGHDWPEGDCVSCSHCGEDKHYWQEANCLTPKTCTACGATEGTRNSRHTYSPWQLTDQKLGRSCTRCAGKDMGGTIEPAYYDALTNVLINTWESREGTRLEFQEDGTFRGDPEGEISGTWEVMGPVCYPFMKNICRLGVNLTFREAGKESSVSGYLGANLWGSNVILVLDEWGFRGWAEGEIAVTEAAAFPAGKWTSCSAQWLRYDPSGHFCEEMTTDYTIEIQEDGSFRAFLPEEVTGKLEKVEGFVGGAFRWEYDQEDGYYVIYIICTEDTLDIELWGFGELTGCRFVQQTQAEIRKEFKEKEAWFNRQLPGEWAADTWLHHHPDHLTELEICTEEEPLEFTFREDGTFSGMAAHGDKMEGTWYYIGSEILNGREVAKVGINYNYEDHTWGWYTAFFDGQGFYLILHSTGGESVHCFEKAV